MVARQKSITSSRENVRHQVVYAQLAHKINEEMRVLPLDALNLWITITRLVKEGMIDLARDRLKYWLMIPQVSLVEVLDPREI